MIDDLDKTKLGRCGVEVAVSETPPHDKTETIDKRAASLLRPTQCTRTNEETHENDTEFEPGAVQIQNGKKIKFSLCLKAKL